MFFKIKKGLDIPLKGRPDERIDVANEVTTVAVLGSDYVGLKPTMLVKEGDRVKEGSPLFEDKKNPGVVVTSPAAGIVSAINRGARRVLISVVIEIDGKDSESFELPDNTSISADQLRKVLQQSGLWASFRTRPYGKVPAVAAVPNSIFVNAMDTNPLAVEPSVIINERASDFAMGVGLLSKFDVPVYVCQGENAKLPELSGSNVQLATFAGKHPAGLSSTHVHFIDPVNAAKSVWTLGYQDVIAIGALFNSGKLDVSRYVAVAGPLVNSPRVFATRLGANLTELVASRTAEGKQRVISGSVLNGHTAVGDTDFLGRYDNLVSVIEEHDDREFMGWIAPGRNKFSALNVFVSSIFKPKSYNISTSQYGSPRAIVPIGVFEKVMPLDILPTPLIKSILVKDTDSAQELGCLELVEEDLSLLSFVDPGKHDFGPVLRSTLTQIEKEG
ncbi:Na(+)-translocating NADH-quinone reductase subunit A [Arenicella xantha]|uniref:Na(+)-translocating NADH-quinone reductase subunit A n=1 Tax=Arenicella xantha TaxID=644221 RepID=A0A395JHX9_9GAMM|nr:Na(+)-translocating NADH-quinone reductase subunit A [Arenicella xantha]RBP48330.1 Na+-transporting NADH:ubiquinone oxidoreductase subunit A [Arenicella xantha]